MLVSYYTDGSVIVDSQSSYLYNIFVQNYRRALNEILQLRNSKKLKTCDSERAKQDKVTLREAIQMSICIVAVCFTDFEHTLVVFELKASLAIKTRRLLRNSR